MASVFKRLSSDRVVLSASGSDMPSSDVDPEAQGHVSGMFLSSRSAKVKAHLVPTLSELFGTTLFLTLAFAGTEAASSRDPSGPPPSRATFLLYVALSFGFSLMVNVWMFGPISGAHLNPAVTLAMVVMKKITLLKAGLYFFAQIVGGIIASVIVRFMIPEKFAVATDLGNGASIAQGFFIELILTAELVFTILMLTCGKNSSPLTAPVGIGLALFIAELVGVQYTGGSLNPARSFGPCVVGTSFGREHWIYWIGPGVGSLLAVGIYKLLDALGHEAIHSQQEFDG